MADYLCTIVTSDFKDMDENSVSFCMLTSEILNSIGRGWMRKATRIISGLGNKNGHI